MFALRNWAVALVFVGAIAVVGCEKDSVGEDPTPTLGQDEGRTNDDGTTEGTNETPQSPSAPPDLTPKVVGESTAPDHRIWKVDVRWKAENDDRYEVVDLWEVKHHPENVTLESLKDVLEFEVSSGAERKGVDHDKLTLKKLRRDGNYLYLDLQYMGVTSTNRRLGFDVDKYFGYLVSVDPEGPKKLYLNGAYHFASSEMGWLFAFDKNRADAKKRVRFHRVAPDFDRNYDHSSGTLSLTFWVEDPRDVELRTQITKPVSPSLEFVKLVKANRDKSVVQLSNAIANGKAKMLVDVGGGKTKMKEFKNLWASCTYQLGDKPLEPRLDVNGQKFVLYRAEKYLDVYMVNPEFAVTAKEEAVEGGKRVLKLQVRLARFTYDGGSHAEDVGGDATTTVVVALD